MSQVQKCADAPVFPLDLGKVRQYCNEALFRDGEMLSLHDTREPTILEDVTRDFVTIFDSTVEAVSDCIADRECGIAAIDVPPVFEDATDDAIAGGLVSVGLTSALFQPASDVQNRTPFTMFSASHQSNDALNNAGLLDISPTDILDFHSDGLIVGDRLGVPTYISVYNTFINYRECGNFYWVPTIAVDGLEEHVADIGLEDDFTFDLTPSIYGESGERIEHVIERRATTAIFRRNENGHITTFMNGKFVGKGGESRDYGPRIKRFQRAISDNPFRFAAKQKSRRMVILNNASGFHARDIFQDPIEGHEETRNYLRSVSRDNLPTGYVT